MFDILSVKKSHTRRRQKSKFPRLMLTRSLQLEKSDHVYYTWPRSTYRPICSDQLPVKYRSSIGQVSVKHRSSIGQASVKRRSSIGQASVKHRSSIGRASVKHRSRISQASVKYRPSIGQVSVKYRFTYWPYRSEENRLRKSARLFRYMFRFGNGKIHCKVGRSCVINVVP